MDHVQEFNNNFDQNPDLAQQLSSRIIGQQAAVESIIPSVQMYAAGLAPEGRPVGVFLLLGPTGTGKTKTVETLAHVLHGSEKSMLKIDCGEFQLEHEVAKLIGAPPGYLGHRETHPMISQQKLEASTSEDCKLSIVLFDEIEKAAMSLGRLLLGVLDRAILHLGDNSVVNFENSLVFLTSNLGAQDMQRAINPEFGFNAPVSGTDPRIDRKLARIAINATRRHFSPEFINRIDSVVTYTPLSPNSLAQILDHLLEEVQQHIRRRLGRASFEIEPTPACRDFLLQRGTSAEFGARELKRTLHRYLTQPLAAKVANGSIKPGALVQIGWDGSSDELRFEVENGSVSRTFKMAAQTETAYRLSA